MSGESGPRFTCHRCGACCTGLTERGGHGFAELAAGVYRLPTDGGLRVFAWEARLFPADELTPALVVADGARDELVVLAYELQADTCPNLDPQDARCTIYEDRPLVCRAFPLIVEPGEEGLEVAASSVCGARVPLAELDGDGDEQRLARAYPQAFAPALAAPEIVSWLVRLVGFLDDLGALEPQAGLEAEAVESTEPAVSLVDRVEEAGVSSEHALRERARRVVDAVREQATSPST